MLEIYLNMLSLPTSPSKNPKGNYTGILREKGGERIWKRLMSIEYLDSKLFHFHLWPFVHTKFRNFSDISQKRHLSMSDLTQVSLQNQNDNTFSRSKPKMKGISLWKINILITVIWSKRFSDGGHIRFSTLFCWLLASELSCFSKTSRRAGLKNCITPN